MARKHVDVQIGQSAIAKSRKCIHESRILLITTSVAVNASRIAVRTSQALMQALPVRSIDAPDLPVAFNPLSAMNDEAIEQIADDLIAAYVEARETGDEARVEAIGRALKIIGRHLAVGLGPKAAGVPMN